jgi:hypothetical protein
MGGRHDRDPVLGSGGDDQREGTIIYHNDANGRIVTIHYHLYGAGCEVFGDVLTAG